MLKTIGCSVTTGLGLDAGQRERPAPNLYDKTRTCLQHAVRDRRDLCCSTAGGRWGNAVKTWELRKRSVWLTHTQHLHLVWNIFGLKYFLIDIGEIKNVNFTDSFMKCFLKFIHDTLCVSYGGTRTDNSSSISIRLSPIIIKCVS